MAGRGLRHPLVPVQVRLQYPLSLVAAVGLRGSDEYQEHSQWHRLQEGMTSFGEPVLIDFDDLYFMFYDITNMHVILLYDTDLTYYVMGFFCEGDTFQVQNNNCY